MIFMLQIVAVEQDIAPEIAQIEASPTLLHPFRGQPYLPLQIGPAGKVAWAHVPVIRDHPAAPATRLRFTGIPRRSSSAVIPRYLMAPAMAGGDLLDR
jgi:hypothetical protein